MLQAVDHVILAVSDLDAATRQYARLLGRSPTWRGGHPGDGTENALFRLENLHLELLSPSEDGDLGNAVAAWIASHGEGPLGVAFATDDADACRAAFAERGLEPEAVEKGLGRDVESGAFREWRHVRLPLARSRGVVLFAIENVSPPDVLPISPPLGEESAAVCGLDHLVIRTQDAEAARALYGDGLGLRLALDREFPQWGARLIFFRVGGTTVELAARSAKSAASEGEILPADEPEPSADQDLFWGLSWRVGDAEGARRRLADAGADVSPIRDGRKPGTRVFTVRDGSCGVPTLMIGPAPR